MIGSFGPTPVAVSRGRLVSPDGTTREWKSAALRSFKVHLIETCEDGEPNLITHVETTTLPVVDRAVLPDVHKALRAKDLLPERHHVDVGYIDAEGLVASARDHGVALVGPPLADNQWQAPPGRWFTIDQFGLGWDRQVATCPAGHTSES